MWTLIDYQLDFFGLLVLSLIAMLAIWRLTGRCQTGRRAFHICCMAVCGLSLVGYRFVSDADAEQRNNLIRHMRAFATTYAAELASLNHSGISNAVQDNDENYLKLVEAQNRWLRASDLISDIYTLRRTEDGTTLLLIDSETDYDHDGQYSTDVEQRTPPGQPYYGFSSQEQVDLAFAGEPVFIAKPYTDVWGTWVSALQPMFRADGTVDGVLGVDFPAAVWARQILNARLSIIGIVAVIEGLLMGFTAIQTLTQHHFKEQQDAAEKLRQFKTTLDQTLDSVFMFRPDDYRLIYVNEGARRHIGFSETELLSMTFPQISPAMNAESFAELVRPVYDGTLPLMTVETLHRHQDGRDIPVEISLQYVHRDTRTPRFVAIVRDITERKRVEFELLKAARIDRLTGLPNRSLFHDRLKYFLERTRNIPGYRFALMFLDFDRFKIINDSLGHDVGDDLLREIADRLRNDLAPVDSISPTDGGTTVSRLGGDEFVVILDDVHHPQQACQTASRLVGTLSENYRLGPHEVQSSASIGVVCSDAGFERPEDMLKAADTAMYQAKAKGKACYVMLDAPSSRSEAQSGLQIDPDGSIVVHGVRVRESASTEGQEADHPMPADEVVVSSR